METVEGTVLHDVDSTLLAAVGYAPTSQRAYCKFHPSARQAAAIWRYEGVTPAEWATWSSSASMGRYFLQNIKGSKTSQRIG